MASDTGLRERKKQRTRDAIVDAAMTLFAERGFDSTTIADIAEAADIAPRTFFGYFASKEDVVFEHNVHVKEWLAERLRSRPPEQTTAEALRAWIEDVLGSPVADPERIALRRRLIESSPALQAHDSHQLGQFEAILAESIARDLDEPAGALRPRLAAAATAAALSALEDYDAEQGDPSGRMRIVDDALAFVSAGIAALRER